MLQWCSSAWDWPAPQVRRNLVKGEPELHYYAQLKAAHVT